MVSSIKCRRLKQKYSQGQPSKRQRTLLGHSLRNNRLPRLVLETLQSYRPVARIATKSDPACTLAGTTVFGRDIRLTFYENDRRRRKFEPVPE